MVDDQNSLLPVPRGLVNSLNSFVACIIYNVLVLGQLAGHSCIATFSVHRITLNAMLISAMTAWFLASPSDADRRLLLYHLLCVIPSTLVALSICVP